MSQWVLWSMVSDATARKKNKRLLWDSSLLFFLPHAIRGRPRQRTQRERQRLQADARFPHDDYFDRTPLQQLRLWRVRGQQQQQQQQRSSPGDESFHKFPRLLSRISLETKTMTSMVGGQPLELAEISISHRTDNGLLKWDRLVKNSRVTLATLNKQSIRTMWACMGEN